MNHEVYELEVYWGPREETPQACAVRLAHLLEALPKIHPCFSKWLQQAMTRAGADAPFCAMPPRLDELAAIFEAGRHYTDMTHQLMRDLGFSVGAW